MQCPRRDIYVLKGGTQQCVFVRRRDPIESASLLKALLDTSVEPCARVPRDTIHNPDGRRSA
ncbi:MAG TPA: hypothetical protein VKE51_10245 [Vicinamibacterales bacterium]|nr:hypothetical protein [Vicinamibacterales bacterium]